MRPRGARIAVRGPWGRPAPPAVREPQGGGWQRYTTLVAPSAEVLLKSEFQTVPKESGCGALPTPPLFAVLGAGVWVGLRAQNNVALGGAGAVPGARCPVPVPVSGQSQVIVKPVKSRVRSGHGLSRSGQVCLVGQGQVRSGVKSGQVRSWAGPVPVPANRCR